MLELIQQWDRAAFVFLNQDIAHPLLDYFFAIVASQRFWMPLLVAGAVVLALRGGYSGRAFLVMAALCVGVGDGVVNRAIRQAVQKPRPHEVEIGARQVGLAREFPPALRIRVRERPKDNPGGDSFTSGHVINNASVAAIAAVLWPRLLPLLACWVAIICFSRVYNGAHYPIDVIGSLPVALLVAWVVVRLCDTALWLLRKKCSRLHQGWMELWAKQTTPAAP